MNTSLKFLIPSFTVLFLAGMVAMFDCPRATHSTLAAHKAMSARRRE
jgi:hypothetical protein